MVVVHVTVAQERQHARHESATVRNGVVHEARFQTSRV